MKSDKHLQNPIEIYVYDDKSIEVESITKPLALIKILETINQINPNSTILLMGRYKNDINTILSSNMFARKTKEDIICKSLPKLKITFLTIHSSKGLGYDNCILLNAIDDKYGFPSMIDDDPLITMIKPEIKEGILYPEERRLFYVAMTRTKNKLYILVPKSRESSFIIEIKDIQNVFIYNEIVTITDNVKTQHLCPVCHNNLLLCNYKKMDYYIFICEKCDFKTNKITTSEPLKTCPECNDILIRRYKNKDNNNVYKCFNFQCNYTITSTNN